MKIRFDGGEQTAEDRTALRDGGLVSSVGAYYKPKDGRIHKVPGRSLFADTASAARIKGLQLATFDDEQDKLLAYSGTVVFESDAGATGTFANAKTGLDASGAYMVWAHANDKWYGVNGVDDNICFEYADIGDGNGEVFGARTAGMIAPAQAPSATPNLHAGTTVRPSAVQQNPGAWLNPADCYDADTATFAHKLSTLSDLGTPSVLIVETIASDGGGLTGRDAIVRWRAKAEKKTFFSTSKVQYRFKAEYYDHVNTVWLEICNEKISVDHDSVRESRVAIPDAIATDNALSTFRFTLTRLSAWSRNMRVEVHDARIEDDPSGAKVSGIQGGFFYVYTEWDENRLLESGPSDESNRVLLPDATYNSVDLANLAATAVNANTTHYKIYRSFDDEIEDTDNPPTETSLNNYGLVTQIPAGTETWSDDLAKSPRYILPQPLALTGVTDGQTWGWYVTDNPPPIGEYIIAYRGTLVVSNGRSLHFLVPGRPESYVRGVSMVSSFPFEEHDNIVCLQTTGDSLFVLAGGIVAIMDDIPNVTNGAATIPEIRTLKGQPGCVSRLASTAYSVTGEKRIAWVSREGIHGSDGNNAINLVDVIDWEANVDVDSLSTCTLDWDASKQVLVFGYDSDGGGANNRYAYIHVFDDEKRSTWGHYGAVASYSAGETAGVKRAYTGDEAGVVYLEGGTADASDSFDASQNVRMEVTSGRIYAEDKGNEYVFHLGLGKIIHTTAGVGETLTLVVTAGFDADDDTQSETYTIDVAAQGAKNFLVDMAGEWFTFSLQHTGQADMAVSEIRIPARIMNPSGTINA